MSVFRVNIYLLAVTVMNNAASGGPWRPTRRTNILSRCDRLILIFAENVDEDVFHFVGFSAVFDSGDDTKYICLESLFVMCTNDSIVKKNDVVISY